MDQYGIGARIKAFDNEHGSSIVTENGWVVFEDGALRETNPYGPLIDPPKSEYERLKIVLQYRQAKLDGAVREFDYLKRDYLLDAQTSKKTKMPPSISIEKAERELSIAQKKVGFARYKVQEVMDKLEAAKPARLKGSERVDALVAERTEELINSIKSFEV